MNGVPALGRPAGNRTLPNPALVPVALGTTVGLATPLTWAIAPAANRNPNPKRDRIFMRTPTVRLTLNDAADVNRVYCFLVVGTCCLAAGGAGGRVTEA